MSWYRLCHSLQTQWRFHNEHRSKKLSKSETNFLKRMHDNRNKKFKTAICHQITPIKLYTPLHRRTGPFSFRGAEVSCPNIFYIACPKIKWFCPNMTWFFFLTRKWLFEKFQRAAVPPPPHRPPLRTPMQSSAMYYRNLNAIRESTKKLLTIKIVNCFNTSYYDYYWFYSHVRISGYWEDISLKYTRVTNS